MKINDVLNILEKYAPTSLSDAYVKKHDAYDNVGIIIDSDKDITGVLFSLDLTCDAVDRAIENNCNLIFTHHPAIYAPIKNITVDMPIFKAINNSIGVISFHLNLDIAKNGIDHYLAEGLGGKNCKILSLIEDGIGYGRQFNLDNTTFNDIVERYKTNFKTDKVVSYGNLNEKVSSVVTLCGQGLSEKTLEQAKGADLIVSADVQHHLILKAMELNIKLLIVSHYSSEFYGFRKVYDNLFDKLGVKTILNVEDKYL